MNKTVVAIMAVITIIIAGIPAMTFAGSCGGGKKSGDSGCNMEDSKTTTTAVCPVCPMEISVTPETPKTEFKGKTFYFMNDKMKEMFIKDPWKYLNKDLTIKGWDKK